MPENLRRVALRKESVDRNRDLPEFQMRPQGVALRKESVDRNFCLGVGEALPPASLSARRAWIEMPALHPGHQCQFVALRKESVDRNLGNAVVHSGHARRSPQGERG